MNCFVPSFDDTSVKACLSGRDKMFVEWPTAPHEDEPASGPMDKHPISHLATQQKHTLTKIVEQKHLQ